MADDKILGEIKEKVEHIDRLLMGNGKVGIAEMARRAFDYMNTEIKSKQGLVDWIFRAVILILLGYIAARIGL